MPLASEVNGDEGWSSLESNLCKGSGGDRGERMRTRGPGTEAGGKREGPGC